MACSCFALVCLCSVRNCFSSEIVSSASVVEKLAVELPIALQYSLGHPSLTLELAGQIVGSSFATDEGSEHSNCYFERSWGSFATLDCRC